MPSLTDEMAAGREPSLLDDIMKTAGATALTAGAHAVKGLTLGLVDPTREVGEYLGEDIYGAAPGWAKTGAEIVGSIPTVEGALAGARKVIPGVGAVPRILQGLVAGGGLGAAESIISGEEPKDVLKHSLLSGAVFGGLEGLGSIPALIQKRKIKDVQKFWSAARTVEEESTLAPSTTIDELAEPMAETTIPEMLEAQKKKLPQATKLASEFWKEPNLLMVFQMTEEPMTVQTADRLVTGTISRWSKDEVVLKIGPGIEEHFPIKDFKPSKSGVQKLRMFRGSPENKVFPRNSALEIQLAQKDIRNLKWGLYKSGTMAKSDIEKLERLVNPRVKRLRDMSEHELAVYSDYLQKLARGEKLPDSVMEQIKIYGPAQTDVRVGIMATFRPARWMFESLNKKVPWLMDRFFNPAVKAVEKRNANQLMLMQQIKAIAEPFSRKDLRKIYEIDQVLSKKIGVPAQTPAYKNIRDAMLEQHYKRLYGDLGPKKAEALHEAHKKFRALMDKMFGDLVGTGRLESKRYIKQYWPLLRDQSVVSRLFGKGKNSLIPQEALPREIKGFMQFMRKNVIDNPETDILKLLQAYTSVYTKLMHLAPVVDDMYGVFKDFRVKKDLRELMRHYLARQLGVTSEIDYRIAATIKGVGEKLPFIGERFAKSFTTRDWQRMGVFFNNLPYYAHMGLRPFAAARNLMQPWLTTGPMIGNRWLVRGYQMMLRADSRAFIKEIGGLQESLGEYTQRLHIRPKFKDKFANWMMWMFRKSDEMNRFAAGLGMASKFDHFFDKLGMTEEFFTKIKLRRFRDSVRVRMRDFSRVYRAFEELETHGYPAGSPAYTKAKNVIDEFSHNRGFQNSKEVLKEIRDTITKEAIGDTQWLYGKDQSPLFGYRAGFLGRQAMTYQTWWLNYVEFIKNLGRVTKGGDYAPLATAMANNMLLTMALMTGVGWSLQKVGRTIAFGPFSGRTVFEGEIPPGVDPFVKSLGMVRAALTLDFEGAEKRFESAVKRAWDNWIPGSLVYKELAKIDVTGPLNLWGQALTPYPTKRYATPEQKVASLFGAQ